MAVEPERDDRRRRAGPGHAGPEAAAAADGGPEVLGGAAAADGLGELSELLTVVLGGLERLQGQPLDERGREGLEWAERAAREAGRLTRELLLLQASRRGDEQRGGGAPAGRDGQGRG